MSGAAACRRARLALEISPGKKSLSLAEMRLTASSYQPEMWAVSEPGLVITLLGLQVAPFTYRLTSHTLANISLHAIGRWFQRAAINSETTAILRDLRTLGDSHSALADRGVGYDFAVPAPDVPLGRGVAVPDEPWIVAVHEASHCVFDLQAGAGVVALWSNGREGWCPARGPTSAGGCLAGYIGEWVITRPDEVPSLDDFRDGMHHSDIRRATAHLGSADPARLLLCWIATKRLVDRHWPAIERIALALWTRGRLSGAEVEALWRQRRIAA